MVSLFDAHTEESYIQITKERCIQAFRGVLPYRQMNKSVYQPDANHKLASMPDEWKNISNND